MRSVTYLYFVRTVLILLAPACSLTACMSALAGPPEVVLHTFNSYADGYNPTTGLIQGSDGNFYGTTYKGGTDSSGTVFKITNSGTLTTLHSFIYSDNANGLIQGSDGNLYGTTFQGGANDNGTVFEISTKGTNFTTLHSFDGTDEARSIAGPIAGVVQGSDGNLYGTTISGGANLYYGTVYQISTGGTTFNILHSFDGTDGATPYAGVIQGSDGNLYGTTYLGGANGAGTVFEVSTDGTTFNTLLSFVGSPTDGADPFASLLEGPDGKLYGTTYSGGIQPQQPNINIEGTIFQLQTQLPFTPLITSFNPVKAHVGEAVTVTGLNLANATSVTINGVTQTVTSDSARSLKFQVSTGTTTGPIIVTTPKGLGSSLTRLVID